MENIMDTLITDRTQADVDRAKYLNSLWDPRALQWKGTPQERAEWEAGPRGAYGFADMNRVTQAAAYLIGRLEELGYSVDVEDVTPAYNIRVSVDPAVGGVVLGGGAYYEGDTATVTAQPSEKYDFAGWKENGQVVSESASYSFVVTGPRNLTAAFALKKFQVIASVDPAGSGDVTGAGTYDIDTEVTVAATAGESYVFTRWIESGETVSEAPQYTFILAEDRALSAVMTKTYAISVTASDTDGGTVSGGGTYLDGQTVTVAAVAGDGYEFVGWSENGSIVSTEAVYSFQAAADRNLSAQFVKTHVITLLVDPAGGGTTTGGGTVLEGAQVTVTAVPDGGYRFVAWKSDGEQVSTSNPYTFVATGDQTLTAVFEEVPVYAITAAIDPPDAGTVTGAGQYQEGATVTLTAVVNDGYDFTGWQENGVVVSTDNPYTFTAAGDRTFMAVFEEKGSRLPAGYTELEYITVGRGAGFDTGIHPTQNKTKVVMDVQMAARVSGTELIFAANTSNNYSFSLQRTSGSVVKAVFSGSTGTSISTTLPTSRTTVQYDGVTGTVFIGSASHSVTKGTYTLSTNLFLFTSYSGGSSISSQLYSAQIYSEETLQRDFVPCKNPSGTVGLYDLVAGKFYSKSWTGTVTAGPAV